jgi:integrase
MPTRSLTVAAVERIKPPAEGQADYFDKGYPGLALRVSYGGTKSWVYFYRLHSGKLRRLTLGRFPAMELADARSAWQDARKAVGKGENPARRKASVADSFAAVADEWLKRDQAHNRSHGEVKRVLDRDVKPAWDGRMIASITRRDVLELIDGIADRGAVTMARRTHAHLHRLFRWSVGRGIIAANPMADLPKPGAPVARDRVLTDSELAVVWKAVSQTEWPFGPLFQLLILTGARREEIGALRWSEIQGDKIELEGARTKNGKPHTIPLSTLAGELIEKLPRIGKSEFAFTTTGETPVSGWSKAKALLDKEAAKINHSRALPGWHIHDLRRTVATGMQRLGISLQVVEALLGHVSGSRAGVVGVYQRHTYDAEKQGALEAWAQHVASIVSDKPTKVIPLRRERKGGRRD